MGAEKSGSFDDSPPTLTSRRFSVNFVSITNPPFPRVFLPMPATLTPSALPAAPSRTAVPEPSILIENPRETFKEFLASKGLRVTSQRLAIFDAAFEQREHFTAENLLERARALDDSVSRATVYRSLPILTESGLVREVDVGRDYKYYMANVRVRTFQAQLICRDCDKIFEVDAPFMEWYGKTVCDKRDMEPESQRLQVIARCRHLQRSARCPHAATAAKSAKN
jgi:Fur family ferric uptake transcriptional regulator